MSPRNVMSGKTLFVALAALLVCAAAAIGAATVVDRGGPTPEEVDRAEQSEGRAVDRVQPELAEHFATFRRGQRAGDQMPASARKMLGDTRVTGKNVSLARRAETPNGDGWVIPGDGYVCLAVPDPVDGYGLACNKTAAATGRGLVSALIDPRQPGRSVIAVLLPDDGEAVVKTSDGQTQRLTATDSVATAAVANGSSVSIVTPRGTNTVPLGAPKSGGGVFDCGGGRTVPVPADGSKPSCD